MFYLSNGLFLQKSEKPIKKPIKVLKMKKLLLFTLFAATIFASCSKEQPERSEVVSGGACFTAVVDDAPKTYLDGNSVVWSSGDEISIFDEAGTNFKFKTENGGETATFVQVTEGELQGTTFYAVYPYSASASISDGTISYTSSTSYYVQGSSFTRSKEAVMVAKTTSNELHFKNVSSLIKFTIPNDVVDIKMLYFYAGGHGIAGAMNITVDGEGTPAATTSSSEGITISMDDKTSLPARTYYLPIIPNTYNNLRVKITYDDNSISEAFSLNQLKAERNKITNIGTIYDGRSWFKWLTFEDGKVPDVFTETGGTLSIVENPVKGNANGSAKALLVSASGSGYINVKLDGISSNIRKSIKSIKFHYKPNGSKFGPRVRFNNLKTGERTPYKVGGNVNDYTVSSTYRDALQSDFWNELEFTAAQYGKENFSDITSIQIRPLVWTSGSDNTVPNSVFIDNIGFSYE